MLQEWLYIIKKNSILTPCLFFPVVSPFILQLAGIAYSFFNKASGPYVPCMFKIICCLLLVLKELAGYRFLCLWGICRHWPAVTQGWCCSRELWVRPAPISPIIVIFFSTRKAPNISYFSLVLSRPSNFSVDSSTSNIPGIWWVCQAVVWGF